MSAPDAATSPIFEAIQATALRTFGRPEYDGVHKHLVIVSDLLQNIPGVFSMYERVPPFESFRQSSYFARVRGDLNDVSVAIYYLVRPSVTTQGVAHVQFWVDYLQAQGATVDSVDKVFGDA
jgi:hypothetical protein